MGLQGKMMYGRLKKYHNKFCVVVMKRVKGNDVYCRNHNGNPLRTVDRTVRQSDMVSCVSWTRLGIDCSICG